MSQPKRYGVSVTVRGPGGPLEKADASWVRAMRSDGNSWGLIASYFDPKPTAAQVRKVAAQ